MALSDDSMGYYGRMGQSPRGRMEAYSTGVSETNARESGGSAAPAGPGQSYYDTIGGYYNQYLGRQPEAGVADQWYRDHKGNLPAIQSAIQQSPEALQYAARSTYGTNSVTGTPVASDGTIPQAQASPNVSQAAAAAPAPAPMPNANLFGMGANLYGAPPGTRQLPGWNETVGPEWDERQNYLWNAMQNMLDNPTFSPQNLAAMKEVQKEQALSMGQQAQQMLQQSAASRGTLPGGHVQRGERAINQEAISNMLNAYRDIDIMGAERNAADMRANLGIGQELLANTLTPLDYQMRLGLAQEGIDDASNARALNWARFLDNALMQRYGLGLQAQGMEQGGQNAMFNWLFGGG